MSVIPSIIISLYWGLSRHSDIRRGWYVGYSIRVLGGRLHTHASGGKITLGSACRGTAPADWLLREAPNIHVYNTNPGGFNLTRLGSTWGLQPDYLIEYSFLISMLDLKLNFSYIAQSYFKIFHLANP